MTQRAARPAATISDSQRVIAAAELVTVDLFATITGYSEKAVRSKREDGTWRVGPDEVLVKAPDGRILVNLPQFYAWAKGAR